MASKIHPLEIAIAAFIVGLLAIEVVEGNLNPNNQSPQSQAVVDLSS